MSIKSKKDLIGCSWKDWTITDYIGSGSGGLTSVYLLERNQNGYVESDRVLKIVNIIEENMSLNEMSDSYRDDFEGKRRFLIKKAQEEVVLMDKLRNCNNIVTYQDYEIKQDDTEEHSSASLYIRMDKNKALADEMKKRYFSEAEIIQVGIDICTALEGCEKNGVIHRDIKPDNIFVTETGRYLLGDFGISTILENGQMASTNAGTAMYAAPEQFKNGDNPIAYDSRVDIYSLGLTLYVLLNGGRYPFVCANVSLPEARQFRLEGKRIPSISGINSQLNSIILKACAYSIEDRYRSANEMKDDLRQVKLRKGREGFSTSVSLDATEIFHSSGGNETEPALNVQASYETEPALNVQASYETEPALNVQASYETEPALNVQASYETEATLNVQLSYETKPAFQVQEHEVKPLAIEDSEELEDKIILYAKAALKDKNRTEVEKAFAELEKQSEWDEIYQIICTYYATDKDIEKDPENAIFWFQYCVDNIKDSWMVSLAEYKLGDIFSRGVGTKKNHKMAEKYFESSASKGNPYAQKKFVAGKYIK